MYLNNRTMVTFKRWQPEKREYINYQKDNRNTLWI